MLIVETGARSDRRGNVFVGQPIIYLMGIVAAMKQRTVIGELVNTTTKVVSVAGEGIDLGIVYKARTIDECVDLVLQTAGVKRASVKSEPITSDSGPSEADKKITGAQE